MAPLPWTAKRPEFLHIEKALQTSTPQTLVNGTTVFRVIGAPIIIQQIVSYCVTACDATASTLQWSADGDVGAATTITAASASLTSFIAGGVITTNFVNLATAPIITGTTGVVLSGITTTGVIVPPGIISMVVGTGSTTGTFLHYLRY